MAIVTSKSSYLARATPGVYVTELDAFGTGIVGVPTAVPIFIGYTEFAGNPATGAPLYRKPVRIGPCWNTASNWRPGACRLRGQAARQSQPALGRQRLRFRIIGFGIIGRRCDQRHAHFCCQYRPTPKAGRADAVLVEFDRHPGEPTQFNLYWTLQAFFANGGGDCFIVLVGSYWVTELPKRAGSGGGRGLAAGKHERRGARQGRDGRRLRRWTHHDRRPRSLRACHQRWQHLDVQWL